MAERRIHSLWELKEAAQEEDGFCLRCGERQEFIPLRDHFGQCEWCFTYTVLPAELLLNVLGLVEEEED